MANKQSQCDLFQRFHVRSAFNWWRWWRSQRLWWLSGRRCIIAGDCINGVRTTGLCVEFYSNAIETMKSDEWSARQTTSRNEDDQRTEIVVWLEWVGRPLSWLPNTHVLISNVAVVSKHPVQFQAKSWIWISIAMLNLNGDNDINYRFLLITFTLVKFRLFAFVYEVRLLDFSVVMRNGTW